MTGGKTTNTRTGSAQERPRDTASAVFGLIAVLLALFVALVAFSTIQARRDAQQRALDRALAASQVVATNARWISELAHQALRRIDEALGDQFSLGPGAAVRDIRQAVDNLPGTVKAYVVDAGGNTLFSTDPQVRPIDITDREYFSVPAAGTEWYTSSLMISRLNGEQIFAFSRRIERNGQFAGVAVISFDVALLRDVWMSLELDQSSTVGLIRSDGMLVARYPFAREVLDMSSHDLFTKHLEEADSGTYHSARSPADGVERFVGYRRAEGTDLVAVASISAGSAYRSFWRSTTMTLLVALPAILAFAAASLWILRLLRRDQSRQAELAAALETNRLLFRDTHHRVKNNLQSVQSLIRMQNIPDQAKMDLQGRIAAMTAVHEHIYRLDQYAEVEAGDFIPAIVEPLLRTYGANVAVTYVIDPLSVDRDQATPIALLVNEVVTNALKYAFPGGRKGAVEIRLERLAGDRVRLSIADDGIGFGGEPANAGMGSRLIRGMVTQLGGTYTYAGEDGTRFVAELALHSRAIDRPPRPAAPVS
ncbi:MAG: sensor histidine kinase [Rhizobiaceae bacterium]|nr:MAG: sensor histidine kinase [Rhizobiaceae bacterium]CAG1010986.1 Blue-light-activated histidine kinase 2 [Rhizobiaceae bacterium]